jgi:hypothetical protein
MKYRVRITELVTDEKVSGEVANLFPRWHTGIIRGDDGYDVAFNDESLIVGMAYEELNVGRRVSYGIFFARGCKAPVAINVLPVPELQPEMDDDAPGSLLTHELGVGAD